MADEELHGSMDLCVPYICLLYMYSKPPHNNHLFIWNFSNSLVMVSTVHN